MEVGLHGARAEAEGVGNVVDRQVRQVVKADRQSHALGQRLDGGSEVEQLVGQVLGGHRPNRRQDVAAPSMVAPCIGGPVDRNPPNPCRRVGVAPDATPVAVRLEERFLDGVCRDLHSITWHK